MAVWTAAVWALIGGGVAEALSGLWAIHEGVRPGHLAGGAQLVDGRHIPV